MKEVSFMPKRAPKKAHILKTKPLDSAGLVKLGIGTAVALTALGIATSAFKK